MKVRAGGQGGNRGMEGGGELLYHVSPLKKGG